jgi:hypothetical protein
VALPAAAFVLALAFTAVIMAVVPIIRALRNPLEIASEPFKFTSERGLTPLLLADGFPFAPFVQLVP